MKGETTGNQPSQESADFDFFCTLSRHSLKAQIIPPDFWEFLSFQCHMKGGSQILSEAKGIAKAAILLLSQDLEGNSTETTMFNRNANQLQPGSLSPQAD